MEGNNETKLVISFYALAYIDILNQKEVLARIDKIPENEEEKQELIKNLKESLGVIDAFRSGFDKVFNHEMSRASFNSLNKISNLTEEKDNLLSRIRGTEIKQQLFSDSMIYYTSMASSPQFIPITGIHRLLYNIIIVLIATLPTGMVCRGGIEAGVAGEFFKGEIYGPALSQAYILESEKAKYPRIVIGEEICKYILSECQRKGNDLESKYRNWIAECCRKMICTDVDGVKILDYFGQTTREMISDTQKSIVDDKESIEKALEFAEKEWERFKSEGNEKLAQRYFMLRHYIRSRKKFWS